MELTDRAVLREPEAAVRDRAQAPKERPILFSGAMVRALLVGTKTQTRRPLKVQPIGTPFAGQASLNRSMTRPVFYAMWETRAADGSTCCICPYGVPGDRLWVRESGIWSDIGFESSAAYMADGAPDESWSRPIRWKPSIHMPRWASRITLEITDVRVERLHDISEADARAEGIVAFGDGNGWHTEDGRHYAGTAVDAYLNLWADINGTASAEANPFVWALSFRKTASGCSHTARSDVQSNADDQEPTTGSSHG